VFIILDDWLAIKIITTDKYPIKYIPLIRHRGLGYKSIVVPARHVIFLQMVLSEL